MHWKSATGLFFLGYIIATTVGYGLYLLSATAMWVGMFTLMPIVFAWLAYVYFNQFLRRHRRIAALELAGYWVLLSFVLDGTIYILLLPVAFGARPNWIFFVSQSPWIWVAYVSLSIAVAAGFRASLATARRRTPDTVNNDHTKRAL